MERGLVDFFEEQPTNLQRHAVYMRESILPSKGLKDVPNIMDEDFPQAPPSKPFHLLEKTYFKSALAAQWLARLAVIAVKKGMLKFCPLRVPQAQMCFCASVLPDSVVARPPGRYLVRSRFFPTNFRNLRSDPSPSFPELLYRMSNGIVEGGVVVDKWSELASAKQFCILVHKDLQNAGTL